MIIKGTFTSPRAKMPGVKFLQRRLNLIHVKLFLLCVGNLQDFSLYTSSFVIKDAFFLISIDVR